MLELNSENALHYLRAKGLVRGGEVARVEELGWGVSNVVLRVTVGGATARSERLPPAAEPAEAGYCEQQGRAFVVKQSREQLRTKDPWFSRLERVWVEKAALEVLGSLLEPGTVPDVLFEDRENYLFVMSAAPEGHRVWKEMLLAGETDGGIASCAGTILATIHGATAVGGPAEAGHNETTAANVAELLADREVFTQLRVDPFYRRVAEAHPVVAPAIAALIDEMFATRAAFVHADFSPKNMLVWPSARAEEAGGTPLLLSEPRMTLVDFETAHYGDPAFDLGFFLSHVMLKGCKHGERREAFFDLTRTFWRAYGARLGAFGGQHGPLPLEDLARRGIAHFAGCTWARLDGTSKIDYLPEEPKREAVRRLCRRVLLDRVSSWRQVLEIAEQEFR